MPTFTVELPMFSVPYFPSFKKVEEEIRSLPDHTLRVISTDIVHCFLKGFEAHQRIIPLYDKLQGLPDFTMRHATELGTYAEALAYTNAVHLIATSPPNQLPALTAEGVKMRQKLRFEFLTLSLNGLGDRSKLDACTGLMHPKAVASDLQILMMALWEVWPSLGERHVIQKEEMERAGILFRSILQLLGARDVPSLKAGETADLRLRAYNLFKFVYDDVKAGVAFLRRQERDADTFMPSLYVKKGKRHNKTKGPEAAPAPVPPPPTGASPGPVLPDPFMT